MATGRTVAKYTRIYAGHYGPDNYPSLLCGLTRSVGPLVHEYPEVDATGMCDNVKGYLPGQPVISPGSINVIMDPTAPAVTTAHMYPNLIYGFVVGTPLITQIAVGIRAAPANGDPVFGGIFPFLGMTGADDGGLMTANFNLGASEDARYLSTCGKAWGQLLHAYGAETAANTAAGIDSGALSSNGGLMILHIFNGSLEEATFKVQHADTNVDGSFADLTGASITHLNTAFGSYYALVPPGTTVNRYLRWQMTTDSYTFVMSFIRG